jgi:hypothetical protein
MGTVVEEGGGGEVVVEGAMRGRRGEQEREAGARVVVEGGGSKGSGVEGAGRSRGLAESGEKTSELQRTVDTHTPTQPHTQRTVDKLAEQNDLHNSCDILGGCELSRGKAKCAYESKQAGRVKLQALPSFRKAMVWERGAPPQYLHAILEDHKELQACDAELRSASSTIGEGPRY